MTDIQSLINALRGNSDQPEVDQGSLYKKNPLAHLDIPGGMKKQLRQIGNNAYVTLRNGGVVGDLVRAGLDSASQDPFVQRLSPGSTYATPSEHTLSQAPEDYQDWSLGDSRHQNAGAMLGDPLNLLPLAGPAASAVKAGARAVTPELGRMAENYMFDTGLAMSAIPKSKAKAMQKLLSGVDSSTLSEADQMLLSTFGSKAAREAQASKKVVKSLTSGVQAEKVAKPAGAKAGKVEPDFWRKIQDTQGEDAVIKAAMSGEHLRPDGYGGYIGAPRTVTSPQSLGAMRSGFDTQFDNAANAIAASDDPSRVGTWYDRAKAGQAASNEPYQLPRSLEQHAVYSAGVSPENELGFSLKHLNSRALGEPEMAYRGAPMRNLETAVTEDRPANLAFKIGEYRNKNDPTIPNTGLFGVNDFRAAQSWGYTDPAGKPWKAGSSATMHPFMDAENALAVQRANALGIGGRTDWAGPHLQEMPWVLNKAEDYYGRGFNAKYKSDSPVEGIKRAVSEANNTMADYIPKHTMSTTWEGVPGANTGHIPEMLNATPEEKLAYTNKARWDVPSPDVNPDSTIGAGNRDAIYSAIGFRQMPTQESMGAYLNSLGVMEQNPSKVGNILVDFAKGSHEVDPKTLGAIGAGEKFRALIGGNEAGAANLLRTTAGTGKTSLLLDSGGRQPTKEQMAKVINILKDTHLNATNSSRGISLLDLNNNANLTNKVLKQKGKELQEAFPSQILKAKQNTVYEAGLGKFNKEGKIIPTKPGSGEATANVLRKFADQPPAVAQNISESESVRDIINKHIARDNEYATARADLQKTRKFFSEENWNKVVQLIRQGMTPAAAVGTLGLSLEGMAAEKE